LVQLLLLTIYVWDDRLVPWEVFPKKKCEEKRVKYT
jgi:hypothetical protein